MSDDLLAAARVLTAEASASVRAAAFLRIARAESAMGVSRAAQTLRQGLEQVRQLPSPNRDYLLEEARLVAAAIAPELLSEIPSPQVGRRRRFIEGQMVRVMLQHGHALAAVDYLLRYDDPAAFPFRCVGDLFQHPGSDLTHSVAHRVAIVRGAVEMWRRIPCTPNDRQREEFACFFGHAWRELPAEEALLVVHEIVERAITEPDEGTSASYMEDIQFSSSRQHVLFKILHILRHLDPALAQSLVDSHEQLAMAARRFPDGLETMREEAAAEAERRKHAGATCEGGYILMGDPNEFDQQRRIIEASRRGEFGPAIDDGLEKYREDSSPASFNDAPKEFWPSTGQFRAVFHLAGQRVGFAAATLLDKIPDLELRLFATIELAAGLANAPEPLIMRRTQPRSPEILRRRMLDARRELASRRNASDYQPMQADDGRVIRCPQCTWRPSANDLWFCSCGHRWNTFSTAGRCPACQFQWEVTQCPSCGETSSHGAWYLADSEAGESRN